MHSAKLLVATAFVSLFVCAVACNGYDGDENSGETSAAAKKDENNPPGNNGTVKIEEANSTTEMPDNHPHVGCSFKIEFRGYDKGDLHATWELAAHPPSGKGEIVREGTLFIGEDGAGGANDLDGTVLVTLTAADLAGLTRQDQQGYHLKLTVHADGSKGADVKHKVFWVDGCGTPDAGTSSSGGSSSGGSSSGGSSSGGSSSGGSSSGGSSSGGSSSGATW